MKNQIKKLENKIQKLEKQIKKRKQQKQNLNKKITIFKKFYNINNNNNLNKGIDNVNNHQKDPINILDVGNYIVEKAKEYPCFLEARNKKHRTNPRHGLFQFDNYMLSRMVYYVYVTSLLNEQPLFSGEILVASCYGTVFPKILDNYNKSVGNMPDGYYIVKGAHDGNSEKLKPETKKMIDNIIEKISQMKSAREFVNINRQQRAYFVTRYPVEKMKEKMNNRLEINEIEFANINDPLNKKITDKLIIECFKNKDIFSIDEDCRYECVPKFFNRWTAYYFPKGIKILSNFRFTEI